MWCVVCGVWRVCGVVSCRVVSCVELLCVCVEMVVCVEMAPVCAEGASCVRLVFCVVECCAVSCYVWLLVLLMFWRYIQGCLWRQS